jgi:hypothetical protein
MKKLLIVMMFFASQAHGQITLQTASDSSVRKYRMGQYSYHEEFKGHKGYGAPLILTADGGAAAFGTGDDGHMLVKLSKTGKVQWKKLVSAKGDEMELQSVVEDKVGNLFTFILVYDNTKYRGGCERVVMYNKTGTLIWDKFIGSCQLLNSPTVSYIKALDDGRIALRGHIVTEQPEKGKDPKYHYWEGWLNTKGVLTQKAGEILDWSDPSWKDKYKPE